MDVTFQQVVGLSLQTQPDFDTLSWMNCVNFTTEKSVSFVYGELDTAAGSVILLLLVLSRKCWRTFVKTDVPPDDPEMSGDELTHVEAVFVITKGIVEVFGDLEPTDEEDESVQTLS